MIVTGNVQVESDHLTLGRDLIVPASLDPTNLAPFRSLAHSIHSSASGHRPIALMQLSHAGRQSPFFLGGRGLFAPASAPSAVALGYNSQSGWLSRLLYNVLFPTPHAMTTTQIGRLVTQFVHGAHCAVETGFDGVQLHAAHGCTSTNLYINCMKLKRRV